VTIAPIFLSTRFSIKDKLAAHSDDATTIGLLNVNPASRMDKSISLSIIPPWTDGVGYSNDLGTNHFMVQGKSCLVIDSANFS
jgi:hypothetical protein